MGFFKDFKEDFQDATDELFLGSEPAGTDEVMVNTLDGDIDVESELTKLDGLLEKVTKKVEEPEQANVSTPVAAPVQETKKEKKVVEPKKNDIMLYQDYDKNLLQHPESVSYQQEYQDNSLYLNCRNEEELFASL